MENIDEAEVVRLLDKRMDAIQAGDEAMRRYYEGRIDGHCLQNAIDRDLLETLARREGYSISWETAMEVVEA